MVLDKKHLVIFGVAVVALGLLGRLWLNEHDARIRGEAAVSAAKQVIDSKDQAIKDRDALAQRDRAANKAQIAGVKSPEQAKRVLEPLLGPLASPTPPPSLPDAPAVKPAPGQYLLSQDQMVGLAKFKLACDQSAADLGTCSADLKDTKDKLAVKDKEVKDLQTEVKGGSVLHRFGKALRVVGCAGLGSGVGALVGGVKGAAIGGAGGAGACQIFW